MKSKRILGFESFNKLNEGTLDDYRKRTAGDYKRIEDIGKWDLAVDLKDTMSTEDKRFLDDVIQRKKPLADRNGTIITSTTNRLLTLLKNYIVDYETLAIFTHSSNFGLNKIAFFLADKGIADDLKNDTIEPILKNTPKSVKDKIDAEWEERKENQEAASDAFRRKETEYVKMKHNSSRNPDDWKDDLENLFDDD